jgi:hypothetical protein
MSWLLAKLGVNLVSSHDDHAQAPNDKLDEQQERDILNMMNRRVGKVQHELALSHKDSFTLRKTKSKTKLVVLLNNEELLDMILEHAKREHSEENIYIYTEIQEFKKMSDVTNGRRIKALEIVEKYLLDDSEYTVNVDSVIKKRVNGIVKQMQDYSIVLKPVREDLFSEVEDAVLTNLNGMFVYVLVLTFLDVLSRFVLTPLAPESLKNINFQEEADANFD